MIRIDHILNDNNSIFFRVLWAEEDQIKGDPLKQRSGGLSGFSAQRYGGPAGPELCGVVALGDQPGDGQ